MDFLKTVNGGQGVTESQFILAILEHLGTIDNAKDIKPWRDKFKEFDEFNTGILTAEGLDSFVARESEIATNHLTQFQPENNRGSMFDGPLRNTFGAANSLYKRDADADVPRPSSGEG
eukprot:gene31558-38979_t